MGLIWFLPNSNQNRSRRGGVMGLILTRQDEEIIAAAWKAGVLCKLDGNRINDEAGTILLGCADGDRFHNLFTHHCRVTGWNRHHPLSLNGGPLLISTKSPIPHAKNDGNVYMRHLRGAMQLKGMHIVVPCGHAPCGVAYSCSLDALDVFRLLIEGKLRIKKEFEGADIKVMVFIHVAYTATRERTYFVDRKAAEEFLHNHGRAVRV